MEPNVILKSLRNFRMLDESIVAKNLDLSLNEYMIIEEGREKIDDCLAKKISNLFKVPFNFFLYEENILSHSINYTYCNFYNSNGYVNRNSQKDQSDSDSGELIRLLKQEVKWLQQQNEDLLKKLSVKCDCEI